MRIIFAVILLFSSLSLYSQDVTSDFSDATKDKSSKRRSPAIVDPDYVPKEVLKKEPVLFDIGGSMEINSRIMIKSDGTNNYFKTSSLGFDPVPNDKWCIYGFGRIWGRLSFMENNFLKISGMGLLYGKNYSFVPYLNVSELYLNWNYPLGKVR